MNDVERSKLLSFLLRHKPEEAGLMLGDGGWVDVSDLLAGLERIGKPMTQDDLERIVQESHKQRFTLSEDGARIRAAQGHSTDVDMKYVPAIPPEELFHGADDKVTRQIIEKGIKPMKRQFVHLSADLETALIVSQRRGPPSVFRVYAQRLHDEGQAFYLADNGVWLTDAIGPGFIHMMPLLHERNIYDFMQARKHFNGPLDMIEAMERYDLKADDVMAALARERGVSLEDIEAEVAPDLKKDED